MNPPNTAPPVSRTTSRVEEWPLAARRRVLRLGGWVGGVGGGGDEGKNGGVKTVTENRG
jgi:hypothetical protein